MFVYNIHVHVEMFVPQFHSTAKIYHLVTGGITMMTIYIFFNRKYCLSFSGLIHVGRWHIILPDHARPCYSNRFSNSIKKQRTCNTLTMVAIFAIGTSNAPSTTPSKHQKTYNNYRSFWRLRESYSHFPLVIIFDFLDKTLQQIQYFHFKTTGKIKW